MSGGECAWVVTLYNIHAYFIQDTQATMHGGGQLGRYERCRFLSTQLPLQDLYLVSTGLKVTN